VGVKMVVVEPPLLVKTLPLENGPTEASNATVPSFVERVATNALE
jgi:hypothetical protein